MGSSSQGAERPVRKAISAGDDSPAFAPPKPYYDEGGITIYHGDALDVLGALEQFEVHAVVTDPPYASGARTEANKSSSGAMLRGSGWEDKPIVNDQMTTGGGE